VEIELEGAREVRRQLPEAVAIFIAPPSQAELARRLTLRGTERAEEIAERLAAGEHELAAMAEFDHRIVNEDVEVAVQELARVVAESIGAAPAAPAPA
jgi:guanylate kinase